MVTEHGDFQYPPIGGEYDLHSRQRAPRPPRIDPLRVHPPTVRAPRAISPRPPHFRPPPTRVRPHPPAEPFSSPSSPQLGSGDQSYRYRPKHRSPVSPTFPTLPYDQSPKPRQRDGYFDRPVRKPPPHRPLRTSVSASRLNSRNPKGYNFHERRAIDPTSGLPLPHSTPNGPSDVFVDDTLRASDNSGLTSRSSIEHASGTERSSVLTKGSSITDLSPETPDGPYGIDEGMSVEDAISMYLDGFSDVAEEPASPENDAEGKSRPMSPPTSTGPPLDDGHISKDHVPDIEPPQDYSYNSQSHLQDTLGDHHEGDRSEDRPQDVAQMSPTPDPPPKDQPQHDAQQAGDDMQQTTVVLPGAVPPPLLSGTDSRDRYGFRKRTNHTSEEQYDSWNGPYSNFVASRRAKWSGMLKENGLSTSEPTVFPPKSFKMKRFVRKGIPPEYRGAAWFWYAGGYDLLNRNPGHYGHLVERAMTSPSNDDKEHIERDLHRTFPDNIHFKPEFTDQPDASSGSSNLKHGSVTLETEMIQSLRRVLYAFSLHNTKVGYTQSLNFITGLLLLFLPEEKTFWMLHIITSIYLPGTHEISLEGANIDLWILMVLLRETMPSAYSKMASTGPTSGRSKTPALTVHSRLPDITLGMTNWLMSVFIGTLPIETVLRVWDVFFYEGSKTFFRVSLAIFKACERDILAVSDPMEVFQVVQTIPKRLLDANAIMEDSFVRRNRVGQGRIDELRDSRRTAVRQDKARRSLAMTQGQLGSATDEWPRSRTPIPGIERSIADSWRQMRQHAFR